MSAGRPRLGIILSGGGARAAYQVGVLRAISDLLPHTAGIADELCLLRAVHADNNQHGPAAL